MNKMQYERFQDFSAAGLAVLGSTILIVLLSTVTHFVSGHPWPQRLFLELFQQSNMQLLGVVLTPSPMFSPMTIILVYSIMPLAFHVYAIYLLLRAIAHLEVRLRVVYSIMAAVPVFGPFAIRTIMKSFGILSDLDH